MRKPCCDKRDTNKGAWSKQEDEKLVNYILKNGETGSWRTLPQAAGLLRCGKSCRLRWINYLRPGLKRGNFGEDEEDLIIKLHALLGNRWSLIAGRLPGRTDNEVKNYWNSHLRRKLTNMGMNPNNPRLIRHNLLHSKIPIHDNSKGLPYTHRYNIAPLNNKFRIDNDQVSDSASCHDDGDYQPCSTQAQVPDLNLDLSVSVSASSMAKLEEDDKIQERKQKQYCSNISSDLQQFSSPTLLLFQ